MKIFFTLLLLISTVFFIGCDLAGPEEKAIREMVETFVTAVDKGDDDIARA